MTQIIFKQTKEPYDPEHHAAAVQRIARANGQPRGDAEHLARDVVGRFSAWLADKTEVTSAELRAETAAIMRDFDGEAAYAYANENKLF